MSITYFVPDERKNGGSYQTVTGEVKRIDAVNGMIQDGRPATHPHCGCFQH